MSSGRDAPRTRILTGWVKWRDSVGSGPGSGPRGLRPQDGRQSLQGRLIGEGCFLVAVCSLKPRPVCHQVSDLPPRFRFHTPGRRGTGALRSPVSWACAHSVLAIWGCCHRGHGLRGLSSKHFSLTLPGAALRVPDQGAGRLTAWRGPWCRVTGGCLLAVPPTAGGGAFSRRALIQL